MSPIESRAGFTYIETTVAVAIVALFFGELYALNTQCLYLLNSGRQAAAAGQSLQDRIEQLRSCTWQELTDSTYIQNNLLNTPTTSGYNIGGSTEAITLNTYPVATSPTTVMRTNGVATVPAANINLVNADLVRVDVSLTWTSGLGARPRSQSCSSIIAKNGQ